jgi:hypothetical protein
MKNWEELRSGNEKEGYEWKIMNKNVGEQGKRKYVYP